MSQLGGGLPGEELFGLELPPPEGIGERFEQAGNTLSSIRATIRNLVSQHCDRCRGSIQQCIGWLGGEVVEILRRSGLYAAHTSEHLMSLATSEVEAAQNACIGTQEQLYESGIIDLPPCMAYDPTRHQECWGVYWVPRKRGFVWQPCHWGPEDESWELAGKWGTEQCAKDWIALELSRRGQEYPGSISGAGEATYEMPPTPAVMPTPIPAPVPQPVPFTQPPRPAIAPPLSAGSTVPCPPDYTVDPATGELTHRCSEWNVREWADPAQPPPIPFRIYGPYSLQHPRDYDIWVYSGSSTESALGFACDPGGRPSRLQEETYRLRSLKEWGPYKPCHTCGAGATAYSGIKVSLFPCIEGVPPDGPTWPPPPPPPPIGECPPCPSCPPPQYTYYAWKRCKPGKEEPPCYVLRSDQKPVAKGDQWLGSYDSIREATIATDAACLACGQSGTSGPAEDCPPGDLWNWALDDCSGTKIGQAGMVVGVPGIDAGLRGNFHLLTQAAMADLGLDWTKGNVIRGA
jgi:hypothetical protein